MKEVKNEVVIRVRELVVGFDGSTVLDHMSLDVFRGEILGFVGGSGAGKSVLMRTILRLAPMREGSIEVFGLDLAKASESERRATERRWGIFVPAWGAIFLT
jgi:phospholipid/cholesterol/gamma-HCH transport system ATP-binding protein